MTRILVTGATGNIGRQVVSELLARRRTVLRGRHQNVWDGTDDHGARLANGAHFARLDAGADHARRTIIVLR